MVAIPPLRHELTGQPPSNAQSIGCTASSRLSHGDGSRYGAKQTKHCKDSNPSSMPWKLRLSMTRRHRSRARVRGAYARARAHSQPLPLLSPQQGALTACLPPQLTEEKRRIDTSLPWPSEVKKSGRAGWPVVGGPFAAMPRPGSLPHGGASLGVSLSLRLSSSHAPTGCKTATPWPPVLPLLHTPTLPPCRLCLVEPDADAHQSLVMVCLSTYPARTHSLSSPPVVRTACFGGPEIPGAYQCPRHPATPHFLLSRGHARWLLVSSTSCLVGGHDAELQDQA